MKALDLAVRFAEGIGGLMFGVSVLGLGAFLVARLGRRYGTDTKIDELIADAAATVRFIGTDEDARVRAVKNRLRADLAKRAGHRILTGDRPVSAERLRMVK